MCVGVGVCWGFCVVVHTHRERGEPPLHTQSTPNLTTPHGLAAGLLQLRDIGQLRSSPVVESLM